MTEKDLEQEVKDDIKEEKSLDDGTQEAWENLSQAERDAMLAEESSDDETPSEDKPEETKDEPEKVEPEVTPEEKPYEILEDGKVRVGKKTFDSVEEAIKSYHNLEKVHGKQAQELGELRKEAVLPETVEEKLEIPKFEDSGIQDEYGNIDGKKLAEYVALVSQNASKETSHTTISQMIERSQQEQALQKFQQDNPDLTTEQLKDIALHGDKHGFPSMEKAYRDMQYDENIKKAKAEGKAEILEQLDQKSPKTSLSGTGSGDSETKIDPNKLSQKDFDKLPEEERNKLLANA